MYWKVATTLSRWLGYFAGQSKSLHSLYIDYLPQDRQQVDAFIRAIKHNRSICTLQISHDVEEGFQNLGSLLKNDNLESISFRYFEIGLECARNIALMLNQPNQRNAMKILEFEETDISDDSMTEIAVAFSAHPQLEELDLCDCSIGRNSCVALGNTLGSWSNPSLNKLSLCFESLDDEGSEVLVAGMRNCHNLTQLSLRGNGSIAVDGFRSLSTLFQYDQCRLKHLYLDSMNMGDEGIRTIATGLASLHSLETLDLSENSVGDDGLLAIATGIASLQLLKTLDLSGNRLISAVGLRSLSALLQSDSCSLTTLYLWDIGFGDDGAAALADGLKGNNKLTTLIFNTGRLTSVGWSAFSRLLCDTSSINNTYLSNHTLVTIGDWSRDAPDDVKQLLALNQRTDKPVAMMKILKIHPDFNVEPLLLWKLKLLPLLMSWFEAATTLVDDHKIIEESEATIRSRKISTLYKFIRGMPLLAMDGYCSHNKRMLAPSISRKRRIDQL